MSTVHKSGSYPIYVKSLNTGDNISSNAYLDYFFSQNNIAKIFQQLEEGSYVYVQAGGSVSPANLGYVGMIDYENACLSEVGVNGDNTSFTQYNINIGDWFIGGRWFDYQNSYYLLAGKANFEVKAFSIWSTLSETVYNTTTGAPTIEVSQNYFTVVNTSDIPYFILNHYKTLGWYTSKDGKYMVCKGVQHAKDLMAFSNNLFWATFTQATPSFNGAVDVEYYQGTAISDVTLMGTQKVIFNNGVGTTKFHMVAPAGTTTNQWIIRFTQGSTVVTKTITSGTTRYTVTTANPMVITI